MSWMKDNLPKQARRQMSHVPGERIVSRKAKRRIRKAMRRLRNAQRLVELRQRRAVRMAAIEFAVGA